MEAKLTVVGGKAQASEYSLRLPSIIGRSRSADIPLAHPLVSRQHCELFEADGRLMVRDLGSLNGTFLGERRLKEPASLPPGSLLTVGSVTFRADYDGPAGGSDDEMPDFLANGEQGDVDKTVQVNGLAALEDAKAHAEAEESPEATNDVGFDMNWLEEEAGGGEHAETTEAPPAKNKAAAKPAAKPVAKPAEPEEDDFQLNETGPVDESAEDTSTSNGSQHAAAADEDDDLFPPAAKAAGTPHEGAAEGGEDLDDFFRSLGEP